jgi:hypothetical protein
MAKSKKKNIKEIEIEEVEEIEEFDDEEFDFVDEDEEVEVKEDDFTPEELEPLTLEERVISIEKKQNIILLLVIVTALLSLLVFITNLAGGNNGTFGDETGEEQQEVQSSTYDTSGFTEITAQELKATSKNKTIIVGGEIPCLHCGQELIRDPETMRCDECELEFGYEDNDNYGHCECCGCRIYYDDAYYVGDDYICDHCFNNECFVCDNCGEAYYNTDKHCVEIEEDRVEYMCPHCCENYKDKGDY